MPFFLMPKLGMPKTEVPSPPTFNVPAHPTPKPAVSLSLSVPELKVPDAAPKFDMPKVDNPLFSMPKSTYPTCPHLRSQGGRAEIRSPHHAKTRHAHHTPHGVQPQCAKIQCANEVVVPGSRCRGREHGATGGARHIAYVCDRNGMQSKVIYSLNTQHKCSGIVCTSQSPKVLASSPQSGTTFVVVYGTRMHPYAYPQHQKRLKHVLYV